MLEKRELSSEELKELHKIDFMVVLAVIALVAVHVMTVYYISSESQRTKADYEKITEVLEANPLAKYRLVLKQSQSLLRFIALPSVVLGAYIFLRKRIKLEYLQMVVYPIFIATALNVVNDLALLIGNF